jgi:hypothetical protein
VAAITGRRKSTQETRQLMIAATSMTLEDAKSNKQGS